MATIRSYPVPARALKAGDAFLGDVDGTVQIPVSVISEAIVASLTLALPGLVASLLPAVFNSLLASLPNEANGDAIPSSGPYLSGGGVVKYAKVSGNA